MNDRGKMSMNNELLRSNNSLSTPDIKELKYIIYLGRIISNNKKNTLLIFLMVFLISIYNATTKLC